MTKGKLNMAYGQEIIDEIDFMLGSIEECNSQPIITILERYGINPDGGWIDIDAVPKEVIKEIAEIIS